MSEGAKLQEHISWISPATPSSRTCMETFYGRDAPEYNVHTSELGFSYKVYMDSTLTFKVSHPP